MLWQREDYDAAPQAGEGKDLPTTFGDTFNAAWSRNQLFGENLTGEQDRLDALGDYLGKIKKETGADLAPELDYGTFGGGGMMPDARSLFRQTNDLITKKQLKFEAISPDDFEQNAVAKRRAADADFEATMSRPRTTGGTIGAVTGGLAAGAADPINIVALPAAPEEGLGILANALRWGAIGAAGQAGTEAVEAPYQEEVQPGYLASGAPLAHIAEAGLSVGASGPLFRGLARAWEATRGLPWPTHVKIAGDVVSSEANIEQSNVYDGAAGAAAHRQALAKASEDILAGAPVDVSEHITPEIEATAPTIEPARAEAQGAAGEAARLRAAEPEPAPELPFEQTAAQAEAETAKGNLAAGVQQIAGRAGYNMPEEEAGQVAEKLLKQSPEEAADTVRDLQISPRQVAEAPTRIAAPAEPEPLPVTPIKDPAELEDAMRADLDRELLATPHEPPPEELRSMIARNAPLEELESHPAVQEALRQNAERPHTATPEDLANPEWRASRLYDFAGQRVVGFDNAVDRLADRARSAAGPAGVAHDRHAVIITGPPAAGKSTVATPLAEQTRSAIMDPDDAKHVIPEYDRGSGTQATHEESSQLAKDVLLKLTEDGSNFIRPMIGADPKKLEAFIEELKADGYTVDLAHVSPGAELAGRRNIERFASTGRIVPPEYIRDVAGKTEQSAYIINGKGLLRDFANISSATRPNTVIAGEGPLAGLVRNGRYEYGQGDRGLAGTAAEARPIQSAIPNAVEAFTPENLAVDARRFQFKEGGDEQGVTDRLKGVTQWDPVKAGMVLVWRDKDGKNFIVDGHQRLALAKRIQEADPAQRPELLAHVLKEADGVTDSQARVIAAMKNIAEGTGSAVDAAKVLRDNPERAKDLPPRSELFRQAQGLANLDNDAFLMVVNGVTPANYGAIVGRLTPDPELQRSLISLLNKTDPANVTQAEAIVRQGIAAGARKAEAGAQGGLFGEQDIAENLYLDRAKVLDRALKDLRRDKTVFNVLSKEQETIEAAGNKLAAEINQKRATHDAQAIQVLQILASRTGPISTALGNAAERLRAGARPGDAAREFTGEVRRLVESGELARLADGIERGPTHVGNEDASRVVERGATPETDERPITFEPGAEGLPQAVMPGMEQSARQLAAAREGPMRAGVPQQSAGGLFAPPETRGSELFPNIDEKPVSLERALSDVDGYKAAAEQLAACGAPAEAEAA